MGLFEAFAGLGPMKSNVGDLGTNGKPRLMLFGACWVLWNVTGVLLGLVECCRVVLGLVQCPQIFPKKEILSDEIYLSQLKNLHLSLENT